VGLDRSSYYDIKFRKPHDGEIRRLLLADAIADIHTRSRGTYGRLRIRAALEIEQGLIVNTKLVARIMRELDIQGLPGVRRGVKNLKNIVTSEDLVQAEVHRQRPQRTLAHRHHRTPDPRGQALLLCGPGSLQPQGCRVVNGPPPRH
jgi:hypothetical protein